MSESTPVLTNTTLSEYEDVFDIARYTTDELFGILEIPRTNLVPVVEARVERMVADIAAAGDTDDATLQFFDDLEERLRQEIILGQDALDTDIDNDGKPDDVMFDQSDPRKNFESFNQYLANSKKRHDMIRPKTVQKIVNVDTRFRNNYYTTRSTDFTITLPYKITDVISTRLAAYEIPCTYHTISSALKNNKFWITGIVMERQTANGGGPMLVDGDTGYGQKNTGLKSMNFEIVIPDGNYFAWYADRRPGLVLQNTINAAIQTTIKDKWTGIFLAQIADSTPAQIETNAFLGDPNIWEGEDDEYETVIVSKLRDKIANLRLFYNTNRSSGKSAFVGNSTNPDGTFTVWQITEYKIIFTELLDDFNVNDIGIELPNTLGWILGFRLPEYTATPLSADRYDLGISIAYGTNEAVVLSEGLCDLRGPKYAYVGVEDFNNNSHEHYMGAFNAGNMKSDVLARISTSTFENVLDAGIQANVSDDMSTTINNTRYYHGPVDIQQLKISLYDEFGRIMDLNEMDWSLALSFEQLHDSGRLM